MVKKPIPFARRLRDLRTAAGLSVEQVSQASGLHKQTVYFLEAGRRAPSLDTARRLAKALGQPLSVFE